MKALDHSGRDVYEGHDFAINARKFGVNFSLAGIHNSLPEEETIYDDGVWVTMNDDTIDELITALQYYKQYRTFKKE